MPTPDQYLSSIDPSHSPQPNRFKRFIKWFLVVVVLFLVLAAIYIGTNLARLSINPFDFSPLKGESEGRINILVLGVGDPGHAGEKLSDTNMVVSISPATKQMAYISLPRDLRVKIPGYGFAKINEANALGGPALARQTVQDTLGIPIDYYAKADFTGLKRAVDAVGGVDINVQQALSDPEYPCAKDESKACGLVIAAGQQHMNGTVALEYARCRKGNCGNDFGRALRQQEVLQQMKSKMFQPSFYLNLVRINDMASVLGDNIETDLSINQLVRLSQLTKSIPPEQVINVVFSNQPGGLLTSGGGSDLVPVGGSFTRIQAAVQNVFTVTPPPKPE